MHSDERALRAALRLYWWMNFATDISAFLIFGSSTVLLTHGGSPFWIITLAWAVLMGIKDQRDYAWHAKQMEWIYNSYDN